jgi:hypothetical protein
MAATYGKGSAKGNSIGCRELAVALREDYTAYSDHERCFKPSASVVYRQIEDAVLETHGWSFEEIVAFVADGNGMTPGQLLGKYKRILTVYGEAKEEMIENGFSS